MNAHGCTHLAADVDDCCPGRKVCIHGVACTHGHCCHECWETRCPENNNSDIERLKSEVRAACRQAGLGTHAQLYFAARLQDAYEAGEKVHRPELPRCNCGSGLPLYEGGCPKCYPLKPETVELRADHPGRRGMRCIGAGGRVLTGDQRCADGRVRCYCCLGWVAVVQGAPPSDLRVVRGAR